MTAVRKDCSAWSLVMQLTRPHCRPVALHSRLATQRHRRTPLPNEIRISTAICSLVAEGS